jgi:MFS family permease
MSQQHEPAADASTAELMRRLSEQTSELVRKELELARVELSAKGKQAGIGAGMFGGAGLTALYAVGALVAAAIAALALAVDTWLAALIVAVVLALVAGVLALQGRSKVKAATPPKPEAAMRTTKRDVETVKHRAKEGRQSG